MKILQEYLEKLSDNEQKRYRYELSKLTEAQVAQLETLVQRMGRSGAAQPLSWAWSEFREGIPQWARFMILKAMYGGARDIEGNVNAAAEFLPETTGIYEMLSAVVGPERLAQFLEGYSKGMLYNLLGTFDEGNPDYDEQDSWLLVTHDRETGELGKPISGLYGDFLEFDQEIAD